ncbi:MAG TPA: heparan-alpha-glucosaminide N-acetyltransferase domain-containing protein [Puia sp.]|nr:heparan-alpha-glucosaminide N-acetyltransferase domain-containing protein [Puia sp.]
MKRLPAIDIARGLVMVIMALDHTRDFLHIHALQSPTDLKTTTPILFFTRWITHLCAPSFVFLSGTSAWLYLHGSTVPTSQSRITGQPSPTTAAGGPEVAARRRFLWKRGLVLILLEFTVVNFALSFDIHFRLFLFEVIATIGAGMVLLSQLSRLKPGIILAIAIVLLAGHDLIAFVNMPSSPVLGFIGSLLFGPGGFPLGSGRLFVVAYPVLPWLAIMLLGFCTGPVFSWPVTAQKRFLVRAGLGALGLFVLLRWLNVYGDPVPWSSKGDGVYTFLSFLNVTKYPPSLLFSLVTLGILLLILAIATRGPAAAGQAATTGHITAGQPAARETAAARILQVYGRVPFFYFVLHLYLLHALLLLVARWQGHPWSEFDFSPFKFGRPPGAGLSLGTVYTIWAAVVIALYPVCHWYGRYKATHKEKTWLRYL